MLVGPRLRHEKNYEAVLLRSRLLRKERKREQEEMRASVLMARKHVNNAFPARPFHFAVIAKHDRSHPWHRDCTHPVPTVLEDAIANSCLITTALAASQGKPDRMASASFMDDERRLAGVVYFVPFKKQIKEMEHFRPAAKED